VRLDLTILGAPLGKGRPRLARQTGRIYTPALTREWEGAARAELASQLPPAWSPLDEPCAVYLTALFGRPARMICSHTSGRCRCEERYPQDRRLPYASRPDGDNVEKLVWDTLQQAGVMRDDALVTDHGARHRYVAVSEAPRVEVVVVWGAELGRLPWPPDAGKDDDGRDE